MLMHKKIRNLNDYFVELNSRQDKGVYFYRINGYSEEIGEFIKEYYDVARKTANGLPINMAEIRTLRQLNSSNI